MPRFLLSSLESDFGQITGDEARHLVKVHRHKVGDVIEVIGERQAYSATISCIEENTVSVRLGAQLQSTEPALEITLYQGLLKGDKQDLIVQKAVELGVHRILIVNCARSIVELSEKKARERAARWQRIAQEASKQCGRTFVPEVSQAVPLAQALPKDNSELRLMAYELGGEALRCSMQGAHSVQTVSCLIGPEGGFTSQEVGLARAHGFRVVGLGPRILRAETAPLALLSIIMYELGDMGGK